MALSLGVVACGEEAPAPPPEVPPEDVTYAPQLAVDLSSMTRTPGGVYVQDTYVGSGRVATQGRRVVLEYAAWLPDGTTVASSSETGRPLTATLGRSDIIPGWQEGLEGMREGGQRKLVIPARLAYGAAGLPPRVPPQSVLVIRTELIDVR